MHVHELLVHAVRVGASDLHISAGEVPAIRLDGAVQRLRNIEPLKPDETKRLIYAIMNERQKAMVEESLEIDFAIGIEGVGRFRVNVFHQVRGIGAVFRTIPDRVRSITDLSLPGVLERIAELPRGLVVVTGPTGSGKSTTLAAMIDHINQNHSHHILTIEDPVEFVHTPAKCVINQRELGAHTYSFSGALRSALREDPDVILVGEMRDLETIGLALTAAETGHLVFGTLHTRGAPDTIARIIDAFPANQQEQVRAMLANSLQAVISQTLLPRKGGGRACSLEIMLVNFAIRNLIRENKVFQIPSIIQGGSGQGMVTFEASLLALLRQGVITREAAVEAFGDARFEEQAAEAERQGREATRKAREEAARREDASRAPPGGRLTGTFSSLPKR